MKESPLFGPEIEQRVRNARVERSRYLTSLLHAGGHRVEQAARKHRGLSSAALAIFAVVVLAGFASTRFRVPNAPLASISPSDLTTQLKDLPASAAFDAH